MDAFETTLWLVSLCAASSSVTLYLVNGRRVGRLVVLNLITLALAGLAWWFCPPAAAVYGLLGLWCVVFWVPLLLSRRLGQQVSIARYEAAARTATMLAWFHPGAGYRDFTRYFGALADVSKGKLDEARQRLRTLESSRTLGELARLEALRLDARWREMVDTFASLPANGRTANLVLLYMRALFETGQVDAALRAYSTLPLALQLAPSSRLVVAAFCGRVAWLNLLFTGALREMHAPMRAYWHAVADQANGAHEAAEVRLLQLLSDAGQMRQWVRNRRDHPAPQVDLNGLSDAAKVVLQSLERRVRMERELGLGRIHTRRPAVTLTTMAGLLGMFLISHPQGVTDHAKLVSLGAMVLPPEAAQGGLWWRVGTAGLLHLDGLHLALNLLGLWALGTRAEKHWGGARVLALLLLSSVGAFATEALLLPHDTTRVRIYVGASAAIMGLLGALAVFCAVGFFYGRNSLLKVPTIATWLALVAQMAFDWDTPIVASSLHIAGFAYGGIVSLVPALRYFTKYKP